MINRSIVRSERSFRAYPLDNPLISGDGLSERGRRARRRFWLSAALAVAIVLIALLVDKLSLW